MINRMIEKLLKKHYKILGGTKYFIDCSNITSEPESIIPNKILKNIDHISIIKAAINYTKHTKKNKHIVIKIAHKDKTNKKEYQIGENLKSIPGFIKYICLFNCFDDTYNYIQTNKKIPKKICTADNISDNDNHVLIMPYINNSSIRNFKWSLENTHILKSLLKQCIMSLMYAYLERGFLHNDLHLDNIMFKKTKLDHIRYRDLEIETKGHKIVIMDFDLSFIGVNREEGIEYYWSNFINLFSRIDFDLNKFIIPLNAIIITSFINKAKINYYDPKKTVELLDLIDKLEFRLPKTLSTPIYNPYFY